MDAPFPSTDAQKRDVLTSPEVAIDGKKFPMSYRVLQRSGDVHGGTFGLITNIDGEPVHAEDGSVDISPDTDFSSLLPVGGKLFSVTHFESRPGAMYVSELFQNAKTGELSVKSTHPINFANFGGIWVPCAGSVTPWGTHLGGEEYSPEARAFEGATETRSLDSSVLAMTRYFKLDPKRDANQDGKPDLKLDAVRAVFNPYSYGYPVEVRVSANGEAIPSKHYAMGRSNLELSYVMPDRKTAYLTDDGSDVGFYMFIADRASDLSSGRLYAMRWNQVDDANGGEADIEWLSLGHASAPEIRALIDKKHKFSDMFEAQKTDPKKHTCPAGFRFTRTDSAGSECLKLKAGQELAASRLETRRYAAYLGATTELRKEEGLTFDPDSSSLYVSISELSKGMTDGDKDEAGGPNHIRLPQNRCGGVYQLRVAPDATFGSDYVARSSKALIMGKPMSYPEGSQFAGNTCSVNGLANPDNLSFIPGRRTLLIGEDTSSHQNDVVWAYQLDTGKLSRILTTPYGSETTSVYVYPNIGGWSYIKAVVQHPYGESDQGKLGPDLSNKRAYDGYLGPFPALH